MKATKDKSKTDSDKPYETDEPVGGASRSHTSDRAYESDIVGGPIPNDIPSVLTLRADRCAGSKTSLSVEAPLPTLTQPRGQLQEPERDARREDSAAEQTQREDPVGNSDAVVIRSRAPSRLEMTLVSDREQLMPPPPATPRRRSVTPTAAKRRRSPVAEARERTSRGSRHHCTPVATPSLSEASSDAESLRSARSGRSMMSHTSMAEIVALRRELRGLRRDINRKHAPAPSFHPRPDGSRLSG